MENLATESFSYSWLTHQQPPPSASDNLRRRSDDEDFHFDVAPSSASHDHLVNADEIFSEGQIMAVYAGRSWAAASVPSSPIAAGGRDRYYIIGKWRRSSKKMLLKLLGFVGCSRKSSSRVHHDIERKVLEAPSSDASPTNSNYYSDLGFNVSPSRSTSYVCCDADDNSIREAILYCKRSILEK